jgi:NAD(P)-dependent dehydrogenase (short-subunit alcohol dehydrogenase family)
MALALDLTGRAALVTGGARGIGKSIAFALGRAGADVVIGATAPGPGPEAVVRDLEREGRKAACVVGDLKDPETSFAYVDACRKELGHLDILVNNAGIWEGAAADAVSPRFLRRMLGTNLEAVFFLCRHAIALLKESPAGRIVNLSSTASLMGEPQHAAYAASKGGLDALTRSLAVELGPHGITVNSVAPGWTRTEMTAEDLASDLGRKMRSEIPLRRVAEPEDVAYAVTFLASDWARHVSGVTLPVEGAYRIRR